MNGLPPPTRSQRVYRGLLKLFFPRETLNDVEEEMVHLFTRYLVSAQGMAAKGAVWIRALWDLAAQGTAERLGLWRDRYRPHHTLPHHPNPREPMLLFFRDLRFAYRGFVKDRTFTLVSILTLGLGIGAATVAFSLVHGILMRPLPFQDPEALVYLMEEGGQGRELMLSYPNFHDWREQTRTLQGLAAIQFPSEVSVVGGAEPARARALQVSREFFRVLGVPPVLGREFSDGENRPGGPGAAVISHEFWVRALGADPGLEDLAITLYGRPRAVVGVMPPGFKALEEADIYLPMEASPVPIRSAHNYRGIGRLAPGTEISGAREELSLMAARLKEEYGDESDAVAVAMRPLRQEVVGTAGAPLTLIMGAAILLLLIACTNQASTLLARGMRRVREMAIRTAIGAERSRLVRQLLTENLLLAVMGGLLGLVLTFGTIQVAKSLGAGMVPRLEGVTVEPRVMVFALLATLSTALAFGLLPALRLSGDTAGALRSGEGEGDTSRSDALWNLLVAGEVALSVVLVAGLALLARSLQEILTEETHFLAHGVVTAEMDLYGAEFRQADARIQFLEAVAPRLRSLPGVEVVGMASRLPTDPGTWTGPVLRSPVTDREDRDEWVAIAGWRVVDEGYFQALSIPLLRGRAFSPQVDRQGAPPVAILNESLAERAFPGEDPIGKQVQALWDREARDFTVVGVVAEARDWRREEGAQPELYVYWPQALASTGSMTAVVRTAADPSALLGPARDALRSLSPNLAAEVRTLEARLGESLRERRFVLAVLGTFSGLSLLLAGIGIYGVVGYTVTRRTREIGIRLALGAAPRTVRLEFFRRAGTVVGGGAVVGFLGAIAVTGFMESLLFDVTPRDPLSLFSAPVLILAVGALAILLPVFRHTRVDPALTMKSE